MLQLASSPALAQEDVVRIDIDATDLPRLLLYGVVTIPITDSMRNESGEIALWYPKWIPGTHGPGGPVQNIAGVIVRDNHGNRVDWKRDPGEVYRILAKPGDGATSLVVEMRYITNQSSANSHGLDTFGSELIGFISANTVVLYPESVKAPEMKVQATLTLPEEWKAASALRLADDQPGGDANAIAYRPTTLETFVDSPIMVGRYMKTYDLVEKDMKDSVPPHDMHVFSEAESVVEIHDEVHKLYQQMVTQIARLFESHHFERFDILVATSNELARNGLEHLTSTFNVIGQRDFQSPKSIRGWDQMLLPHEYIHSWCGKYRRPAGMATIDFHTPKDTELLWVYEGLTQYLGNVIEIRCGLGTDEEFRWDLVGWIRSARLQQGREWRPLSDTGAASHTLRGGSRNWGRLRRGQDYYMEGALVWMEADAFIRNETDNERSLDDFCQIFFAYHEDQPIPRPFTRSDVVHAMNEVLEHDWDTFFAERIERPQEKFPLGVLDELGYTLQYSNTPPEGPDNARIDELDARDSIGAMFGGDGSVREVILGTPADEAGLGPNMKIVGVDEYVWSKERLVDAIAASAASGELKLMLISGDKYITRIVKYDGGPRYMTLVRNSDKPDRLADILKPVGKGE